MAKPVSIFGKDLQTNVRQRNKLSHFLLTMSSVNNRLKNGGCFLRLITIVHLYSSGLLKRK